MAISIGSLAPNLYVETWVQGKPTNIEENRGKVILVEVFQVNCPGCFLYGIPQVIDLYQKFKDEEFIVLGLATAFEDYDKNTIENLRLLLSTGEVIGETFKALSSYNQLKDNKFLPYKIPFPVGMDTIRPEKSDLSEDKVRDFIEEHFPEYRQYSEKDKSILFERVKEYLKNKKFSALTFETYNLRGTPSSIIIDKEGYLRNISFGTEDSIGYVVERLINE